MGFSSLEPSLCGIQLLFRHPFGTIYLLQILPNTVGIIFSLFRSLDHCLSLLNCSLRLANLLYPGAFLGLCQLCLSPFNHRLGCLHLGRRHFIIQHRQHLTGFNFITFRNFKLSYFPGHFTTHCNLCSLYST